MLKERQVKAKKPKVQGETLQIKIRDIITNVVNEIGNPVSFAHYYIIIFMCVSSVAGSQWYYPDSRLRLAYSSKLLYDGTWLLA